MKINELKIKCYSLKELDKFEKSRSYKYGIDISELSYFKLLKQRDELIILIFMCKNKNTMKKYLRQLIHYRKLLSTKINRLKIVLVNYEEYNQMHKQFKELLVPIYCRNIYNIYDKGYNLACDYLDSYFYGKNLCDFCNNKCGYKKNTNCDIGCCRHFAKHKRFGLLFGEKLVPCEHLGKDGKCTIKCMRCKLYSCPYLEKKGIKFNTTNIFSLYAVFNPLQRLILNTIAYEDKPVILKIVNFLR